MSEAGAFTAEEWRTLRFAPFWMLAGVAGAYRRFDPIEFDAFSRSVREAAAAPGRLNHDVMTSVATDIERLAAEFADDRRTIAAGLCEVAAILRRAAPEEAQLLKAALIAEIGAGVARSRGRFGRTISEEDAKNLELVAQFLA